MADHKDTLKLPLMMRLKFFIGSFLYNRCMRSDGTINRRLLNLLDPKTPAATTAVVGGVAVSSSDISVDPSRDLWFRLFVPSTAAVKLPLIVYFHDGGFSCFTADSKVSDDLCRTLAAKLPAAVASVNYRLAPEHKWQSQYDDGFDALKFINDQNDVVLPSNIDLHRCFLAGDSAGGNIAHHVAVRACEDRELLDRINLAGVVAVQPFFGGEERTEAELRLTEVPMLSAESADALWRMFLPAGADRDHAAANVFGDGGGERLKEVDFPRTLVVVGGFDPLQDWQRRYVKGLEECGKQVELVSMLMLSIVSMLFKNCPSLDCWFKMLQGLSPRIKNFKKNNIWSCQINNGHPREKLRVISKNEPEYTAKKSPKLTGAACMYHIRIHHKDNDMWHFSLKGGPHLPYINTLVAWYTHGYTNVVHTNLCETDPSPK